jgi:phosphatidylglycerophosphate synthase
MNRNHNELPGRLESAEPVRRTVEIEEPTNLWLIHPIAARLTFLFARWRIRPNAVSIAGMLCGVLAGLAYSHYRDLRCTIAGFLLMIAWHVMDGADGQLARLTHSQSEFGKVLDGACDHVSTTSVYLGFALSLSGQYGGWVWGVLALAGACHAVQAAAYESQREQYDTWGWGRALPAAKPGQVAAMFSAPADFLHRFYMRVQRMVGAVSVEFNAGLAAILSAQPDCAGAIRRRYRAAFAPAVREWSVLSSNYRTLAIFLCALAKAPLVYFSFEVIGFNAILAILLARQSARRKRFLQSLR